MDYLKFLENDYKLHKKARTTKHAKYPSRYVVPDDKVSWDVQFQEYQPIEYNAPIVLDANTLWADPQDITKVTHAFTSFVGDVKFNKMGFPLNPFGRTGISGRGVLGKWGTNFAVDGLITTYDAETNNFLVLTIIRKDNNEIALPGGMVDYGENALQTRNRELYEELSLTSNDLSLAVYEKQISRAYVDDPRNTDNAWIETTVIHSHFVFETAKQLILSASDDARGYQWINVNKMNLQKFYANHALSVLSAITKLLSKPHPFLSKQACSLFGEINEI